MDDGTKNTKNDTCWYFIPVVSAQEKHRTPRPHIRNNHGENPSPQAIWAMTCIQKRGFSWSLMSHQVTHRPRALTTKLNPIQSKPQSSPKPNPTKRFFATIRGVGRRCRWWCFLSQVFGFRKYVELRVSRYFCMYVGIWFWTMARDDPGPGLDLCCWLVIN